MKIVLLTYKDIDFQAYDSCIESSPYRTVYAMSWYLDIVTPGWKLLTTADYQYVMPVPVKREMGIHYAVQPFLCQQLGLFSNHTITWEIMQLFLKKIPPSMYYLQMNAGNVFSSNQLKFKVNLVLLLNNPYSVLSDNYSSNCRRNVSKGSKNELVLSTKLDEKVYLEFLKLHGNEHIHITLHVVERIIKELPKKGNLVEIWAAQSPQGLILAVVMFVKWNNRIYYFSPTSSVEGKKKSAMFFLVDRIIEKFSGQEMILDFEGSSDENVARFYTGFGAKPETYVSIQKNLSRFICIRSIFSRLKNFFPKN